MAGAPAAAMALQRSARRTALVTWLLELDIEILLQTVEPLDKLIQMGPLRTHQHLLSLFFATLGPAGDGPRPRVADSTATHNSRVRFWRKNNSRRGRRHCHKALERSGSSAASRMLSQKGAEFGNVRCGC